MATQEDVTAKETVVSGCCHVGSDGKCTGCTSDETVECSGDCGSDFPIIAAKAIRCKNKDCEAAFCEECAKENLSEHGYCGDCNTISCDGCEGDLEAGTEKFCANAECTNGAGNTRYGLCEDCAPNLLTEAGLCASCAGEEESECNGCDSHFIESRLKKCGGFDECGSRHCATCAKKNLNAAGYCEDCSSFTCASCENSADRASATACLECKKQFCGKCAPQSLRSGRCVRCSPEALHCATCNTVSFQTEVLVCQNCNSKHCSRCGLRACVKCMKKLCAACTDKCRKCNKVFCASHDALSRRGRCKNCRGFFG